MRVHIQILFACAVEVLLHDPESACFYTQIPDQTECSKRISESNLSCSVCGVLGEKTVESNPQSSERNQGCVWVL